MACLSPSAGEGLAGESALWKRSHEASRRKCEMLLSDIPPVATLRAWPPPRACLVLYPLCASALRNDNREACGERG